MLVFIFRGMSASSHTGWVSPHIRHRGVALWLLGVFGWIRGRSRYSGTGCEGRSSGLSCTRVHCMSQPLPQFSECPRKDKRQWWLFQCILTLIRIGKHQRAFEIRWYPWLFTSYITSSSLIKQCIPVYLWLQRKAEKITNFLTHFEKAVVVADLDAAPYLSPRYEGGINVFRKYIIQYKTIAVSVLEQGLVAHILLRLVCISYNQSQLSSAAGMKSR